MLELFSIRPQQSCRIVIIYQWWVLLLVTGLWSFLIFFTDLKLFYSASPDGSENTFGRSSTSCNSLSYSLELTRSLTRNGYRGGCASYSQGSGWAGLSGTSTTYSGRRSRWCPPCPSLWIPCACSRRQNLGSCSKSHKLSLMNGIGFYGLFGRSGTGIKMWTHMSLPLEWAE